jgi:hypothetical protein
VNFEELGEGSASSRQMWLAEMDAARCAARYADGDYTDAILEGTYLEAPVDTEPNVGSNSQDRKRLDPLWPRLLLCVRGKERQLSVALLYKVVNDLLGWILDIVCDLIEIFLEKSVKIACGCYRYLHLLVQ